MYVYRSTLLFPSLHFASNLEPRTPNGLRMGGLPIVCIHIYVCISLHFALPFASPRFKFRCPIYNYMLKHSMGPYIDCGWPDLGSNAMSSAFQKHLKSQKSNCLHIAPFIAAEGTSFRMNISNYWHIMLFLFSFLFRAVAGAFVWVSMFLNKDNHTSDVLLVFIVAACTFFRWDIIKSYEWTTFGFFYANDGSTRSVFCQRLTWHV